VAGVVTSALDAAVIRCAVDELGAMPARTGRPLLAEELAQQAAMVGIAVEVLTDLEWSGGGGNCPDCKASPMGLRHETSCRLATVAGLPRRV
jgi:hypothetical protein